MDGQKGSNQKSLVFGFLIIGALFFGISLYFSLKNTSEIAGGRRVGRVSRETGTVSIIRNGYTQKAKVSRHLPVYSLDSIETNDTGEALLSLESLHQVKILDSSLVTLESEESGTSTHIVLIIKKGEIRLEGRGRDGELFIAKNGERIPAENYSYSDLSSSPTASGPTMDLPKNSTSLSEEEIAGVMASQASLFRRCYTQLLQKDEKAQGTVNLYFTIENSGKLIDTNLDGTSLLKGKYGEDFKKCLLDVMTRISFRTFGGMQISTRYPLKFE
jgi:hypothetical protein